MKGIYFFIISGFLFALPYILQHSIVNMGSILFNMDFSNQFVTVTLIFHLIAVGIIMKGIVKILKSRKNQVTIQQKP